MMIHDITNLAGRWKAKKRVGRGEGSGHGKQSGRGSKGAKARSGYAAKRGFEGGQMPYFRRLPKFGFTNAAFKTQFWTVNIVDIIALPAFAKGGEVTIDRLIESGLVRDTSRDLKILGHLGAVKDGKPAPKLGVKLNVTAARVSENARKLIIDAGGTVNETGTRRDRVRGIDRNSEDKSPKNLTKKLKRSSGSRGAKLVAAEAAAPAEGKADAKAEAKADAKASPKTEGKADAKPAAKAGSKPDAKPEAKGDKKGEKPGGKGKAGA